ncbi:hypothetical protein Leryth_017001 [Lithospermum erythrorhizon]|nr:hypothetical protein Leryth_017001 [Lithospermum erythrorhizon]
MSRDQREMCREACRRCRFAHAISDLEYVLDKALTLIYKCKASGFCCFFTVIPAAEFRKISLQLEYSIGDVSWTLPRNSHQLMLVMMSNTLGLPQLQDNRPILAIGFLGCDPKCVEEIVNAGVCSVFAKILEEGHMKLQIVVAWAVSELAAHHPKCQDHFAQTNTIRLLVSHIAFETIHEHTVLLANSSKTNNNNNVMEDETTNQMHNQIDGREHEDPATKAEMKAMAARALRFLCAGNVSICKDITESRAILCFSELLENGAENGKYHSAMALIEITLVTKHNPELKPSTFKPFAQVSKAALDQFLAIMNNN